MEIGLQAVKFPPLLMLKWGTGSATSNELENYVHINASGRRRPGGTALG